MSRLITRRRGGIRTPDGLIAHTGFRDRLDRRQKPMNKEIGPGGNEKGNGMPSADDGALRRAIGTAGRQQLRAYQLTAASQVGATMRRGSMTGDTEINFTLRIDGIGAVAAPLVAPGTSPVKAGPTAAFARGKLSLTSPPWLLCPKAVALEVPNTAGRWLVWSENGSAVGDSTATREQDLESAVGSRSAGSNRKTRARASAGFVPVACRTKLYGALTGIELAPARRRQLLRGNPGVSSPGSISVPQIVLIGHAPRTIN